MNDYRNSPTIKFHTDVFPAHRCPSITLFLKRERLETRLVRIHFNSHRSCANSFPRHQDVLGFLGKKNSETVILDTEMSNKCLVLISSVAFVGVTLYTFFLCMFLLRNCFLEECTRYYTPGTDRHPPAPTPTMNLSKAFKPDKVNCDLTQDEFQSPSLEDVIHALASKENPGISSISGLALYFNLNNACQPLGDVSKASVQVYKFALVTLVNETACPLQRLALNAQNTGYAVLVHFFVTRYLDTHHKYKLINLPKTIPSEEKVVIPVATVGMCWNESKLNLDGVRWAVVSAVDELMLSKADRTIVEISVKVPLDDPDRNELKKMEGYLKYLFVWLLVGPLVYFVVWMRSSGRQPNQQRGNGVETAAEMETRIMEEGELPLLNGVLYGSNTRQRRCIIVRKCFYKVLVGLCYLILIVAALPVGISSGGLSFFRFDQGDNSFPEDNYFLNPFKCKSGERNFSYMENRTVLVAYNVPFPLTRFVALWWSPFQLFCFFLYSYFARKTTWTVLSNYPKVIRSDWFSSNIYLLVLALIVPFSPYPDLCSLYFATNNVLCTVCNVLFIVILDKHEAVTRYILFLSVCVICAYIESDIVALVYYILNSTGSLVDVKLTALRTAAIGLTLSVSLNSSMHIIRKLWKPQESLFEGLSEK